ncbi:MAG: UPF0182 family protein [Bacillota bacterium]|nr:UPF0182 family protein [Bacillota bacterium]
MKKSFKGKKPALGLIVFAVVFLISIAVALTGFITDWMWFSEVGYVSVFFTEIVAKIKIGLPAFLISAALALVFLAFLKRNFLAKNNFIVEDIQRKRLAMLMYILAAVFGIILAASLIDGMWFEILKFANSTSFDLADPLFNKDVGFYVFKLEFLEGLANFALLFAVILIGLTVVFYVLLLSMADKREPRYEDGQSEGNGIIYKGPQIDLGNFKGKLHALLGVASNEIVILGVLFFLAVAVRFYLMQFDLLYGGTGVAYGAGYTDIKVTLTIYKIVQICSLVSAATLVIAVKGHKYLVGIVFPAIIVLAIAVNGPLAGVVQNLVVSPDEINKESKYIGYNIDYTRKAYGLSDIEVKDFSPENTLTKADVLDNMETFSNIRINDFEPAEQFYNQTQSIRSYYTFNDVDVDRYYVNGEYTQVFLSGREIDQEKVEDSWLIRHLKYTHGYGITLSRVDKITSSGQPDMLIDSIPPVSEVPEIKITRPEIYYGESTDDYVIVNTDEEEFDYPSGEENVYCKYEGDGGIPLTFFRKIMFAIREGSMKLLVSGNINKDSRIMIYRDIMTRVQKIAPFLLYDGSPYLIVDEQGKLFWMIDAYTCSEYYPYSEPYSGESDINYIRNSVKIIVDAYNGKTDFYIVDEADPIAQTLSKIYPTLFKELSEMPASLKSHMKYPNALVQIQASVYKKYHMTNEEVFYQNEDLWAIAKEVYGQSETELSPINFIMKLPGESTAEFITSVPYTPDGKSNMTGILIARNDGANYGQLVLYRLPKDRIIYGPAQIEAQINQDADISKEFSLWNNSGVSYNRGNLFVFPVEDSLIYAEPIYMESSSSSLPEVKRVIMYYGDKLAYESTLPECLDTLFGEGAGAPLLSANPIETGHEMAQNPDDIEVVEPVVDPTEEDIVLPSEEELKEKEQMKELIKQTEDVLNKLLEKFNKL